MNSESQKIPIGQILKGWIQTISVCLTELRPQIFVSILITIAAIFLSTWFLVPVESAFSASMTVSVVVILSIWLLLMSHLNSSEQMQRPLNYAASLPVPRWQLWLSRIFVITIIQMMVTGLLIGAGYFWIKLASLSENPDTVIRGFFGMTVTFALWLTALFHAWSVTRQGYLWLVVICIVVLMFTGYDQEKEAFIWPLAFRPIVFLALAVGLALSYLGFVNRIKGVRLIKSGKKNTRATRGWRPWLIRGGALVGAILGIIALRQSNSYYSAVHQTENLEFSSSEEDVAIIQPLIDSGETHFEVVRDFLGPVETKGRFQVIVTEVFDGTGYGGIANWNMIRLGRDALDHQKLFPPDELFRHELTHVFLVLLSDGKLRRHFDAMQVFHEGVATYCQSLPDTETMTRYQAHSVLEALTSEQWNKEMTFSDVLNGKGDPYGHGYILAKALAEEFGADSFRRIALEVNDLETKAIFYKGEAFWYLLCNRLGFSIELLELRYLKLKEEFAKANQEILSLPEPDPIVTWEFDGGVTFKQRKNSAHDARLAIFVSTGENLLSEYEKPLTTDDNGHITLSAERIQELTDASSDGIVRYLPGWIHKAHHLPLYDKAKKLPQSPLQPEDGHELLSATKLIRFSSEHSADRKASFAIDRTPETFWHTSWGKTTPEHPHELVIDLGEIREISRFHYLARQDAGWNGTFKDCEFYVSDDPSHFETLAARTEFKKTKDFQSATCDAPVEGRYVMVRALSEINDGQWASAAEIIIEAKLPR